MLCQESTWAPWLLEILKDPVWGYMRGFNLAMWVIAISIMYIVGGLFFWSVRSKKPNRVEKELRWAYGWWMWVMGITRICFVFAYWVEPYYNLFLAVGYFCGAASLVPLVYALEKWIIKQTRFAFSIVAFGVTIFSGFFLLFPYQSALARGVQNYALPFVATVFVGLYIRRILASEGIVRRKGSMTLFGYFVVTSGIIVDGEAMIQTNFYLAYAAPFIFITGILLLGGSMLRDDFNPSQWLSNLWIIDQKSGICVFEGNYGLLTMNSDLIAGFLMANLNFARELTNKEIEQIIFSDTAIIFKNMPRYILAMTVVRPAPHPHISRLIKILGHTFNERYLRYLKNWNGDSSLFYPFGKDIEKLTQKASSGMAILLETKVIK
jgi:hypothetical protein